MDLLTKNPGLQLVAEEIFQNLNVLDLENCEEVSKSWKAILRNSSFWLRKCRKNDDNDVDSKKTGNAWKTVISMVLKDTNLEENLCCHLKMICKGEENYKSPIYWASENGHSDVVKVLAPISNNPNAPDHGINGCTPILLAAMNGHVEVIKVLAQLTENPNESNYDGETPMYVAAENGHANVIKILAPLTKYPNKGLPRPNQKVTPIYMAAENGKKYICHNFTKFLIVLTIKIF